MSLPAGWSATPLGELFDTGAGKTVNAEARSREPKHPFLRTANVLWGRLDLSAVDRMYFGPADLENKTLQAGDLLVCEGGDIGRAAIWRGEIPHCGFQNHVHRLRRKRTGIVPAFFMYALQAGFTLHAKYEGAGNKTTIPNLSRSRLEALVVPEPPPGEQERIAAVLELIRRAITNEEVALRLTRELQRATLEKLFSDGLRGEPQRETDIGAMPASWDVVRFSELREFLQYGTSTKCEYTPEGNSVLRIPNVVDGRIDARDLKWCRLEEKVVANLLLAPGDVLFIRTNGVQERVGTCAVYDGTPGEALFASYLIRARIRKDALNPDFLCYFTATRRGADLLAGRASPAADGKFNINTKTIDSMSVPLPSPKEQEDIVTALKRIDAVIDLRVRRLTALRQLFNSFLDKLMTGELSVAALDIDTSEVLST